MKIKPYAAVLLLLVFAFSCGNRRQAQHSGTAGSDSPAFVQTVPEGWESLLDGQTLVGWETVRYGGEGEPSVKDGILTLPMALGGMMTGVCFAGSNFPANNYELYYEARRIEGHDIFGGVSFPCGDTFATLIVGGWGGLVCGLSSIDGRDASENETTRYINFRDGQWYPVHLRITPDSIRARIDTVQVVSIATAGRRIHLRGGTSADKLTLTSYLTTGEIRNLRLKKW